MILKEQPLHQNQMIGLNNDCAHPQKNQRIKSNKKNKRINQIKIHEAAVRTMPIYIKLLIKWNSP